MDDDLSDTARLKEIVLAQRPAQKKIAEKFDNILCNIASGRLPSVYTMVAYNVVKAKGTATSADIVAAMTGGAGPKAYSIGTARSQTGQLMALFDTLKIAKRSGNTLTLNPNSTLAAAIDRLAGAGDAAS
ncbi:hypothetical protein [Azospirillum argentinense]|uniref:hypothetical protein n=1 Tax=Azospirillum argentinense TaxID=2970906 RepID=UPI0032DFF544